MIVLMHSPYPYYEIDGSISIVGISYISAPGLVLFFMISGSLLLEETLSTKVFLKRRFSKVLWPTLFWSLFYLIERLSISKLSVNEMVKSFLSIPFSPQGNGVLWFMYALAGLYLLTPILSRWLKTASKREVEFYLLLWGVTLLYPYLTLALKVVQGTSGILYYFTGFVGYYVLGYYLKLYYKKISVLYILASLFFAIAIPAAIYCSGTEFDFYSVLWTLSLPVALMAFCWYVVFMRFPNKYSSFAVNASKLSFGVYLVHMFFLKRIIWNLDFICDMPGLSLMQTLAIMIITILVSYFVVWLISLMPFSKYIIGV
jgi:surface polysaccharide O-acyltransferase-like enzyme